MDDSARPLFDSTDFRFLDGEKSPWPWVMERPAREQPGSYTDWYFFGYGHDYKKALGDYVKVAGRIPLPPRFAFGVWWSRYWAYSDQELNELVGGFRENDTPLDVFVIDMDWHLSDQQLKAMGAVDQSGQMLGWTGYTWNKVLFPDPDAFLKQPSRGRPEDHDESASRGGHSAVGGCVSGDGARHGHRSGDEEIHSLRSHRQEVGDELPRPGSASARKAGRGLLVARLAAAAPDDASCRA